MPDHSSDLSDKGVLITGAGRGIGKRLAIGFASVGARVALLGRNQSELDATKLEIAHPGVGAIRIRADVRDFEQVSAAVDRMIVVFGGLHILVCCAGILGPVGAFASVRMSQWKEAFDTNLLGVAHACRAALPHMIERRSGKIIVLAGGGSSSGRPFVTAHAASKTAVVRLVESIAEEVRDTNVQVNCLDPGSAYTSITDEILRAGAAAGPAETEQAERIRITGGTPAEKQIQMALFLASPRSNHISGKLIHATDDPRKLQKQNMTADSYVLRHLKS